MKDFMHICMDIHASQWRVIVRYKGIVDELNSIWSERYTFRSICFFTLFFFFNIDQKPLTTEKQKEYINCCLIQKVATLALTFLMAKWADEVCNIEVQMDQ